MRHNKKVNHLGRTASHRKALMKNLMISLIMHKRIFTTVAKAKALRRHIEPLLTRSKEDTMHNRRMAFAALNMKEAVTELFNIIAPKIANRPGGYTRIIKTGRRLGDGAEMCMIELVDFNALYTREEKAQTRKRTRRGGRKKSTSTPENTQVVATTTSSADAASPSDNQQDDTTSASSGSQQEKTSE
ncbi:MAG: 50S ribosomal protein L17 [Cytophagales bacterium]|nr:50S ribosomal protein L17 [Cytophagales bacterium]MDW8385255.1 50S ribosomal protein L17 [Flammeovirgaceae bacterium]